MLIKLVSLYSCADIFHPPKWGISETARPIRKILFLQGVSVKCHICIKNLGAGGSGGHGVNCQKGAHRAKKFLVSAKYLRNRSRYRNETFGVGGARPGRNFLGKVQFDWAWHLRHSDVNNGHLDLFNGTFWPFGTFKWQQVQTGEMAQNVPQH